MVNDKSFGRLAAEEAVDTARVAAEEVYDLGKTLVNEIAGFFTCSSGDSPSNSGSKPSSSHRCTCNDD